MFNMRAQQSQNRDEGIQLVRPNDKNEYIVADGISSPVFRIILVYFILFIKELLLLLLNPPSVTHSLTTDLC